MLTHSNNSDRPPGADLFTTNIMFMITAFLHRHVTIKDVLKSWIIPHLCNPGRRNALLHDYHNRLRRGLD